MKLLSWHTVARLVLLMASWIGSILIFSSIGVCHGASLNQTNFESGEMTLWETFVTSNGTIGKPDWPRVTSFETVEEGQKSKALGLKVGQIRYDPERKRDQGGGLVAKITTDTGMLSLSTHVAVTYDSPKDERNLAGGLFEWILDNQVIGSHRMGAIKRNSTTRHHLTAQHLVNAGVHTIQLRITRPFISHPGQHAPFQYIDDLLIDFSPHQ